MSPDDLSKLGTESGHQKAVFAWAAMAQRFGFDVAFDPDVYSRQGLSGITKDRWKPVPELEWLHAIPNGGLRDARTASLMKAEGVRKGVADVFLPVIRRAAFMVGGQSYVFGGLYIEMKKPKGGVQSDEQKAFEEYCETHGYRYVLCKSWHDAAMEIRSYIQQPPIE